MNSQHLEAEIARLMAALPGASIATSRQLKKQIADLRSQLDAAKQRERATDE